jgi:hypothetical protein
MSVGAATVRPHAMEADDVTRRVGHAAFPDRLELPG